MRDTFGILEFVNADTIAEGLSAFAPEEVAFDAGRFMLGRLHDLASDGKDFGFETTLASRFYAGWLQDLTAQGYHSSLIFLWLESVELAIERVRERVRIGGHDIPEETIRRRYARGVKNLFELYIPVVDGWSVRDNSSARSIEIARYTTEAGQLVFDEDLWKKMRT